MKPISKTYTRQHLIARCAYLGAVARLDGRTLHLDWRGGTWPTSDPDLDLGLMLKTQLGVEGYDLDEVTVTGVTFVPPTYSSDPSALDLSEREYERQRVTRG